MEIPSPNELSYNGVKGYKIYVYSLESDVIEEMTCAGDLDGVCLQKKYFKILPKISGKNLKRVVAGKINQVDFYNCPQLEEIVSYSTIEFCSRGSYRTSIIKDSPNVTIYCDSDIDYDCTSGSLKNLYSKGFRIKSGIFGFYVTNVLNPNLKLGYSDIIGNNVKIINSRDGKGQVLIPYETNEITAFYIPKMTEISCEQTNIRMGRPRKSREDAAIWQRSLYHATQTSIRIENNELIFSDDDLTIPSFNFTGLFGIMVDNTVRIQSLSADKSLQIDNIMPHWHPNPCLVAPLIEAEGNLFVIPIVSNSSTGDSSYIFRYCTARIRGTYVFSGITPTSFMIDSYRIDYIQDDIKLEYLKYYIGDEEIASYYYPIMLPHPSLKIEGFPGRSYNIRIIAKISYGEWSDVSEIENVTIKLPTPTLGDVIAQNLGEGGTRIKVETNLRNMSDIVGIQWRKFDAPESLKSSEAKATVINGNIAGVIKNLSFSSYYKVRAFFEYTNGIRYYSDWTTFDPSDFSYFEPELSVETAGEITPSSVALTGQILQGSDAITEQGFEIWQTAGSRAAQGMKRIPVAVGNIIRAEVSDLYPDTEYTYRTYVVTANGTFYSSERTFTTKPEPSAIDEIWVDNPVESPAESLNDKLYDLSGRCVGTLEDKSSLRPGIYITSGGRKIFIR